LGYCKRSASVFHHLPLSDIVTCFPTNSMKQNAVIFFWEVGCSLLWARNITAVHHWSLYIGRQINSMPSYPTPEHPF
jgi:hypothetical protein